MADQGPTSGKKKKYRSPSYPAISLGKAIERAEILHSCEQRHSAHIDAILKHWGYSPKSGLGMVTVAALKKFGLLIDQGSGARREARLTDLALRIILDKREGSVDREKAIHEAALNPPIHSELWEEYGGVLPSDTNLEYRLTVERGFSEAAASDFIGEFKATIEFAGLEKSDTISEQKGDKHPEGAMENQMSQTTSGIAREGATELIPRQEAEVPTSSTLLKTIQLPLSSTEWATLQASFPLSEAAWKQMMAVLTAMKPALVAAGGNELDQGAE